MGERKERVFFLLLFLCDWLNLFLQEGLTLSFFVGIDKKKNVNSDREFKDAKQERRKWKFDFFSEIFNAVF